MTRTGYKMTEIGEMPEEWEVLAFEEAFNKQESKQSKIPASKFKNKGKFPIIDQGMDLISGYTDNDELLYNGNLPLIIFGDHTLCVKYVDFQFAVGADGTKLLIPNNQRFSPRFLFFTILGKNLKSEGYKRHFSKLRKQFFQCPGINEQQKIAEILSTADETIQKVNEEITLTENLKKGLMQTLLTKGIGHTKFMITELGEIPEEWEVVNLNSLTYDFKNGFSSGRRSSEGVVQVRMNNISTDGRLLLDSYIRVPAPKNLTEYTLENGDFLFNNTNSIDLVGKSAVFNGAQFLCTFSNHFTRFRFYPDKILPEIMLLQFITLWETGIFKSLATRYVGQASIPTDLLLHMAVKVPPMQEQIEIREMSRTLNQKLNLLYYRKDKLENLKKGLMQSLLTGKLRVKMNTSKGED